MFNQDDDFYLIGLNILITCFAGNICKLWGEVTHQSPLGVIGLIHRIPGQEVQDWDLGGVFMLFPGQDTLLLQYLSPPRAQFFIG